MTRMVANREIDLIYLGFTPMQLIRGVPVIKARVELTLLEKRTRINLIYKPHTAVTLLVFGQDIN